MLEKKTNITTLKGRNDPCYYVLIPSQIWHDSQFPFKLKEKLHLKVKGKKIIISKVRKTKKILKKQKVR